MMADIMYATSANTNVPSARVATTNLGGDVGSTGDTVSSDTNEFYVNIPHANPAARQRWPGLYVGNLTWWTTDQDVINAIESIGIKDVQEVKFSENRNNGQSKGFCVVTFASETSLPIVMEKLPKIDLYGQNPVVTHYNRQNLSHFEAQNKATRPQINANAPNSHAVGMGINMIGNVHAGPVQPGATMPNMPHYGQGPASALPAYNANPYNQYNPGVYVGWPQNNAPGMYPNNVRMGMRGPRAMMRGMAPRHVSPSIHDDRLAASTRHEERLPVANRHEERLPSSSRHEERLPISSRHEERHSSSGRHEERHSSSSRHEERLTSSRHDERYSSSSRHDDSRHSSSRRDEPSSSSSRRDDRSSASRRDERSSARKEDAYDSSSSSRRARDSSPSRYDDKYKRQRRH